MTELLPHGPHSLTELCVCGPEPRFLCDFVGCKVRDTGQCLFDDDQPAALSSMPNFDVEVDSSW